MEFCIISLIREHYLTNLSHINRWSGVFRRLYKWELHGCRKSIRSI